MLVFAARVHAANPSAKTLRALQRASRYFELAHEEERMRNLLSALFPPEWLFRYQDEDDYAGPV